MISLLLRHGIVAHRAAIAFFAVAVAAPVPAPAQINPFRGPQMLNLTEEDMQLMEAAASKLRQNDSTPIGQTESWSNPKSGSSGEVTLVQRFQRRDLPCQKIRHSIRDKVRPNPSTFDIDLCRVETGEWKIGF